MLALSIRQPYGKSIPAKPGPQPFFQRNMGRGLCEAMRWLMETEYLHASDWLRSWPHRNAVMPNADRVLNYSGRSLAGFKGAWNDLVADYDSRGDYLNRKIPL